MTARHTFWHLGCLGAAALAALGLGVSAPVRAQTARAAAPANAPVHAPAAPAPKAPEAPVKPPADIPADGAPPSPDDAVADPLDPEKLAPEDADDAPRPGQRPVVRDGDLSYPAEPVQPQDGAADTPEPEAPQDGADPTTTDQRSAEDIEVFENPPAGYDPLLFQIEDVDPLTTDRRPERLFRAEPFDPIGIKLGSFVYFPEAALGVLVTDNATSTPGGAADVAAEIATHSRLVSNWSVHALEFESTGLLSLYDDFTEEDDRAWSLAARGRLDITRLTNLEGLLSRDVTQESRSAVDATASAERPDVTTDVAALTLNHRFNRLSLQLRGALSEVDYTSTGSGPTFESNADRDHTQNTEAVRASWEFKPTFSVFSEFEHVGREYSAAPASDGIVRDSDGERYRFGVDFGATGKVLRGQASLGYGHQAPQDNRLGDVDTMLFDANLAWRMTALTSLMLTARTDMSDTTTVNSGGVVTHGLGLEIRHTFRRYLVATAGVAYADRDYADNPLAESELVTTLGADYFLNRDVILFGRYQYTDFRSNEAGADWHANDLRVGVRVRR